MTNNRYLETRILSADPIELVQIVYQHAIDMVSNARRSLAQGDIAGRSRSIRKATDAIAELDGSLNRAQGGSISQNLAGLYRYMQTRLTIANQQQADDPLAEVESLLTTLAEAWSTVRPGPAEWVAEPVMTGAWESAFAGSSPVGAANHGWSL